MVFHLIQSAPPGCRQDGFRQIVRSSGTAQSEGGSTLWSHVLRHEVVKFLMDGFPVAFEWFSSGF